MGCEGHEGTLFDLAYVSIHTPAWGVKLQIGSSKIMVIVSIHTPAWGVKLVQMAIKDVVAVSIHTPAWGVNFKK